MKIKTRKLSYDKVMELPHEVHKKPMKQNVLFRRLIHLLSLWELWRVHFSSKKIDMEKLEKNQPCLILMNHSSFIDLEIVAKLFCDRPYQIVCTLDGLIGKKWLMRMLGCIPTKKFMMDMTLIRDMVYAVKKLNSSIVMYPEASYSFDGTATPLPDSLGKCLKLLEVPVIMVRTYGAFHRDPLYNGLRKRKVRVSAEAKYLISPEEIRSKTPQELNDILQKEFEFDHFRWQLEQKIPVRERFRAEGLNRVLYKCPSCLAEGRMKGYGTRLICQDCGKEYEMTEYGQMQAAEGETEISHIPDWYQWERECVRQELMDGTYRLDVPVDIYMMVNTKCIYGVGTGNLLHSAEGFHLSGCEGKLDYRQAPGASYSLYSDFFWYEIGDMISIGNTEVQYYCFPKVEKDLAAKTRLAAEELYKLTKTTKKRRAPEE